MPANKAKRVSSCLGGGFVPADEPVLSGEGLQFGQLWTESVVALVALVGQQHGGYRPPVAKGDLKKTHKNSRHQQQTFICYQQPFLQIYLGVQVAFPLEDGLKRGEPGHVEDHQGSYGLFVVNTGHVAIAFLPF